MTEFPPHWYFFLQGNTLGQLGDHLHFLSPCHLPWEPRKEGDKPGSVSHFVSTRNTSIQSCAQKGNLVEMRIYKEGEMIVRRPTIASLHELRVAILWCRPWCRWALWPFYLYRVFWGVSGYIRRCRVIFYKEANYKFSDHHNGVILEGKWARVFKNCHIPRKGQESESKCTTKVSGQRWSLRQFILLKMEPHWYNDITAEAASMQHFKVTFSNSQWKEKYFKLWVCS